MIISGFKRLLRTGWVHSWWIKAAERLKLLKLSNPKTALFVFTTFSPTETLICVPLRMTSGLLSIMMLLIGRLRVRMCRMRSLFPCSGVHARICRRESIKPHLCFNCSSRRCAGKGQGPGAGGGSGGGRRGQGTQIPVLGGGGGPGGLEAARGQGRLGARGCQKEMSTKGFRVLVHAKAEHALLTAPRVAPRSVPLLLGPPVSVQGLDRVEVLSALLGPRFCQVFRQYCLGQSWCKTESGVSLLELYLHFANATGWLSPVNVAAWQPSQLPMGLVADVPACFVHETEYPQLKLCRPLLSIET